ncbi:SERA-3, partial [Plasmodium yoelii yoelii]
PSTDDQKVQAKGENELPNPVQSSSELGDPSKPGPKITNPGSGATGPDGTPSVPTKQGASAPTGPVPGNSDQGNVVSEPKESGDTEGKGNKGSNNPDDPNSKGKQSDNAPGSDNTLQTKKPGTDDASLENAKKLSQDTDNPPKVVEGTEHVEKPTISDSDPSAIKTEVTKGPQAPEIQLPSSEKSNTHTSDPNSDIHSQTLSPPVNNPISTDQDAVNTLESLQSDSPSAESVPSIIESIPFQDFDIKSAMLKNYKGLKITGQCNSSFFMFFVPYVYIDVDTKINQISIFSTKKKVNGTTNDVPTQLIEFKSEDDTLQNQCADNKTFKIVIYLDNGVLHVKWKVYDPSSETEPNTNVDVRKYRLKNIETPITSIQVHNVKRTLKNITIESKNYTINDDLPEKCEAIASDCFLHGNVDTEKCYKCALLYRDTPITDKCYDYLPDDYKESLKTDRLVTAQSEDEINYELMGHIDNVLEGIYNIDEDNNNNNKELKKFEELDDEIKKDMLLYCKELKESDVSGTLEEYALGDVEDIFYNLIQLINNNTGVVISKLKNKLMNPAICLKDVNQWGEKKKGLVLPELSSNNFDNLNDKNDDTTINSKLDEKLEEEGFDGVIDLPLPHENEFEGYTTIADFQYCNNEYCDRLKDNNSCISKIDVEEQGNCATSWLFASKFHLDTIGCMKGHENFSASALYVANCSKKDSKDKCLTGSNPLEFLNIIDENKFLPTTSNLPYSYKKVGEECPKAMDNWTNLWKDVKLLKHENNDKSLNANGYISYQSKDFKDNFSEYINLIKQEIQNKGSIIAYINSKDIISYDFNGSKIHKLCGSDTPDMAVNIIGYGKYINENNQVKSYWLVRNSWGKHWADEGNFKVDIETPENCEHNFIHTFATFNIYIPFVKKNIPSESEINLYYSKNSPDFYNNLYFKNLDATDTNKDSIIEGQNEPAKVADSEETNQLTGDGQLKSQQGGETKELSGSDGEKKENEGVESETLPTDSEGETQKLKQEQQQQQQQQQQQLHSQPQPEPQPEPQPAPQVKVEGQEQVQEQVQEQRADSKQVDGAEITKNVTGQEEKKEIGTENSSSKGKEQQPAAKASEGQQPVNVPEQQAGRAQAADSITKLQAVKIEFMHILKQIKNGRVQMNLVKYGDELNMIDDRMCSRVHAINYDKKDECEKFCITKWSECQTATSPGYCLSKLYESNDCYFCYV